MADFLAELYVTCRQLHSGLEARAASAAASLTSDGTRVSFVGTIFVPEDETWFWIVDAPSAEAVRETGRRAGVELDRIVRARMRTVLPKKEKL